MTFSMSTVYTRVLLVVLLLATVLVYRPGLDGTFMFDDIVHVSNNPLVAIPSLSPQHLYQAWNSSPFAFPASRPLSMLTFGINHALTGGDPYWYKVTNLLLHLLNGIGIFLLCRLTGRVYVRIHQLDALSGNVERWALLASAFWLLSPVNLSPVLYVVQRMAGLSTFFVILAMISYVAGRQRMLDGRGGLWLAVGLTPALGALAFLAKESGGLLFPLLLVMEWVLLQFNTATAIQRRVLLAFFLITTALPATAAALYLAVDQHWILSGYATRSFTLLERLMTETRVLWFYLQLLLAPVYSQLGFYHDDFAVSTGVLQPPTTLLAILALVAALLYAIQSRKSNPILSFGILFFFVGHSLESSFVPLEIIHEHRNYLPGIGVYMVLAYYLAVFATQRGLSMAGTGVAALLLILFSYTTLLRSADWSNQQTLILAEASNHPDSPRVAYLAGQMLTTLMQSSANPEKIYPIARQYLEHCVQLNSANADGYFGLIALNLTARVPVEKQWLDELKRRLEFVPYDPHNITTAQFTALAQWQIADASDLPPEEILGIFAAVLRNPALPRLAKASVESALAVYYHESLRDWPSAIQHAGLAAGLWPENWNYQEMLIQLLVESGHYDDATQQLHKARGFDASGAHATKAAALDQLIRSQRQP
jgi:hypothetical protein